jgi:membrane protease YdiL (CAAX protease family)
MNITSEKKSYLWYVASIFWNINERRLRALWRLLGAVLFIVIFSIIIGGLASVSGIASPAPYMGQLQSNIATVLAIWLATRFLDRRKFSDTGIQLKKDWWIDLGFGLVLGALLMAAIFLVELAAGWITISETFRTANSGQPFIVAILLPALFYLSVGIAEELAFRGYMLLNVAEGFNLRFISPRGALIISWLLTSALFGIAHAIRPNATVVSIANITLAGIWLSLGYILTGSLAISIGAHITWNFFQGHVFGFPVSGTNFFPTTFTAIEQGGPKLWTGGAFGLEASLMGLFAVALGALLVAVWVRIRYGKLTFFTAIANPPPERQTTAGDASGRNAL